MIGIYKIQNKLNNKVYIGQSLNVENRLYIHKQALNRNAHENEHLQRAWNKYGGENFIFELVETCCENELTSREQYYIDKFGGINSDNTYNQREASSHGRHSEYTKQKIGDLQRGKKKPGRVVSEEGRKRLSEAHKGHIVSQETRLKMSLAHKGKQCHNETSKKLISEKNKEFYKNNPELRKRISERMSNRVVSEATKQKISKSKQGKTYKDNKERIKKHSEAIKLAYKTGKKKAVWITVDGITKMQKEWAEYIGVSVNTLIYHRKKGEGCVEQYIKDMMIKKNL